MKYGRYLLFIFLLCSVSIAKNSVTTASSNNKSTKHQTAPINDDNTSSPEILVPVKVSGKWGYVNQKGKMIIEPTYNEAQVFSEGVAWVKVNKSWCLIDSKGGLIGDFDKYKYVTPFKDGCSIVDFDPILHAIAPGAMAYIHHYVFVDKTGYPIIAHLYYDAARPFSEGLAAAGTNGVLITNKGKYHGMIFINKSGVIAFPNTYHYTQDFHEGLAAVYLETEANSGIYGCIYIDQHGNMAFLKTFKTGWSFVDGIARVAIGKLERDDRKFGYIDKTGNLIIEGIYKDAEDFSEGFAAVKLKDKWGFIDKTGKIISEPFFDKCNAFKEGCAAVHLKGKWGFIDTSGKISVSPMFDEVGDFHEGIAVVKSKGKWGYIDKNGKFIVNPSLDQAYPFMNGIAAVEKNKKYGYIDKTGQEVIEAKYDDIGIYQYELPAKFVSPITEHIEPNL